MDKNNRTIYGLAAASAVMVALLYWQDSIINSQQDTISLHEKNISTLQTQIQQDAVTEAELRRENELLRGENHSLRDSIFWLQNRVKQLEDRLQFEEKQLADLRRQIAKKDKFIAFLNEKLAKLEAEPAVAEASVPQAAPPPSPARPAIAQREFGKKPAPQPPTPAPLTGIGKILMAPKVQPENALVPKPKIEAALAQTEKEKAELEKSATKLETDHSTTAASLDAAKMMERLRADAADLARSTNVKFSNLALKAEKAGRPIDKLDKDGKNWLITEMRIELSNSNPAADLSDKKFAVEIVDADSGQPVPNIESNPAFPNSPANSAGFTFRWKGAALEATYFSRDPKAGRNYDLRVFHLFDSQKIEMPQATRALIRDGKIVG